MTTIEFIFNQNQIVLNQRLEVKQLMFHLNLISTKLSSKD